MHEAALTQALFPARDELPIVERTVGALLRERAAEDPGASALLEIDSTGAPGREWTYGELLEDAEALARALATRFAPGERIVVWSPNSPEWVLTEYACALAGLTLVTANPAYQARELAYVLNQSRAAALFLVQEHRGNPMAEIGAAAAAEAPTLREIVDMEDPAQLRARGPRAAAPAEAAPGDEAQLQYTSGTTGFPKGARLHHRGLVTNAMHFMHRAGVRKGDVIANYMPLFHTSGCGMAVLGAVQNACRLLMFRVFDPAAVLDRIESHRVNAMTGVPTMLLALLEEQARRPRDCGSVRIAVSGGSMVAPEIVRRIASTFGCRFQIVYGQTETSPVICQHRLDDSLEDVAESVGQPLPRQSVSIRSVEDGSVVGIGETGEICVSGYCRMLGYNDDPEATARTIDAEGWLHTGDLGTMDARGYVRVTGRVKEMIIRGGENLFPAEIENCLLEHPEVGEVAVLGLPDARWGEIVAAVIRPAPGCAPTPGALRTHCRERLAPIKTPVVWLRTAEFPLTGSGKVQKFALREMWARGELAEL